MTKLSFLIGASAIKLRSDDIDIYRDYKYICTNQKSHHLGFLWKTTKTFTEKRMEHCELNAPGRKARYWVFTEGGLTDLLGKCYHFTSLKEFTLSLTKGKCEKGTKEREIIGWDVVDLPGDALKQCRWSKEFLPADQQEHAHRYIFNDKVYRSSVRYHELDCNDVSRNTGKAQMKCKDGTWETHTACDPIECLITDHGLSKSGITSLKEGDTHELQSSCKDGFVKTNGTITCTKDGTFKKTPKTCGCDNFTPLEGKFLDHDKLDLRIGKFKMFQIEVDQDVPAPFTCTGLYKEPIIQCVERDAGLRLKAKTVGNCECNAKTPWADGATYDFALEDSLKIDGKLSFKPNCPNGVVLQEGEVLCTYTDNDLRLKMIKKPSCGCKSDTEITGKTEFDLSVHNNFEKVKIDETIEVGIDCEHGVQTKAQLQCIKEDDKMQLKVIKDATCACGTKTPLVNCDKEWCPFTFLKETVGVNTAIKIELICSPGEIDQKGEAKCTVEQGKALVHVTKYPSCKCSADQLKLSPLYEIADHGAFTGKIQGKCLSTQETIDFPCNNQTGAIDFTHVKCDKMFFKPVYDEHKCEMTDTDNDCGAGHRPFTWAQGLEKDGFTYEEHDNDKAKQEAPSCSVQCFYKPEFTKLPSQCQYESSHKCGDGHFPFEWLKGPEDKGFTYETQDDERAKKEAEAQCGKPCKYLPIFEDKSKCVLTGPTKENECGTGYLEVKEWKQGPEDEGYTYDQENNELAKSDESAQCEVPCGWKFEETDCVLDDENVPKQCGLGTRNYEWKQGPRSEGFTNVTNDDRPKRVCLIDCKCTMDDIPNPEHYHMEATPESFEALNAQCIETGESVVLECQKSTGHVVSKTHCPQPTCKTTDIVDKEFYQIKEDEEGFPGVLTGFCKYGDDFELQCKNQTIEYTKPCATAPKCMDSMDCGDITSDQCGNKNNTKWHEASMHCCKCGKTLWNFDAWSECTLQENQTCGVGYQTAIYTCPYDDADCGSRPYALTTCTVACDDANELWTNRMNDKHSSDDTSDDKPIEGILIFAKDEDDCGSSAPRIPSADNLSHTDASSGVKES